MNYEFLNTISLLKEYEGYNKQLESLLWGTIEVREQRESRYIYLHRRQGEILKTIYVGKYTEELYNDLLSNNKRAQVIKKSLQVLLNKLRSKGITPFNLSDKVKLNIDFAKRNLIDSIYKQAVLEGVAVTFLDTETIIEGGKVSGVSVDDIQKINNLKHAWQFILDEGVLTSPSSYDVLCFINRLVEEGFYYNAGSLRSVPVSISGTKWKPDLPIESLVKEELSTILSIDDIYERALNSLLFVTKKQLFIDGNKRTAVIFANHILISNGAGLVVIPEDKVDEYKKLLIHYYETDEKVKIIDFLSKFCLTKI